MRHRSLSYSYALARAILVVLCTASAASGADLLVNMTPSPTTVIAGANVTYTIRVDNNAFDDALNVVLTAALPTGSVFVSVTPPVGATCTYPAPGTCNLGTMTGGSSRTVVLVLRLTTPPSFTNTASVTTTTSDTNLTNNSISKTVTVVAGANLTADKTGIQTAASAGLGVNVTYTITTQNLGPQNATSLVVTDTLPANTTFVSVLGTGWSCSASGQVVTCTRPGPAAIAALPNIVLVARLLVNGTFTNSVTIGSAVADPQPNNNTGTFDITLSGADVSVTKAVSPNPADVGSPVSWTIAARNNSPVPTTNVTVSDPLPAGFTFVSVTPAQCAYNSGSHTVNCLFPAVASNTALPTVTINTIPTTAGAFNNVATVGSDLADPIPSNNSIGRSLTVQATASADLATTKTVTPSAVLPGGTLTYAITVRNNGPSVVLAGATMTITDTLPAGVTYVSASGTGWICSFSTGTVTCTRAGALAVNVSTSPVNISVTANAVGSFSNTACVTAVGAGADLTPANNCGSVTAPATAASADLVITKSGSPNSVAGGFPLTYTLTVTNIGPDPATSVVVTDTLTTATVLSATSSVGTCTAVSPVTCSLGNMAVGATATMTVQIRPLNPTATTTPRGNTATVTSQTGDPDRSNNSATTTTTITAGADLQTTKIVTPNPVPVGAQITFVITTLNVGSPVVTATGVTMTDTLPANIRLISVTPSQGTCPTVPPLNTTLLTTTTLSCNIGTLTSTTQRTVTVIAEPTATGVYVNTATSTAAQPDWNSSNDIATANFTVIAAQVDLSVIKIDTLDPVAVGTNFNYLITVVNNGPSRVPTVVLTENIPAQFDFVSISTSKGSCAGTGPITCSFADLANGESVDLTLTMTASTLGSFTNQASVSAAETDSNPLNNTTTEQTTAKQAADLSITKSGTPNPVRLNENITFTLTVNNAGPAASALTNVMDTLPANLTLISATPSQGTCAAGNPISCALGTVLNGGNATITVVAQASSLGAATNTATVSGSEPDSIPGNNSVSFPYVVASVPDLTISKTHSGSFPLGGTGTFTLTVQNAGSAPTDGAAVTVADTLPAGFTPVSAAGTGWACTVAAPSVSCTRSDVLANAASYPPISMTVTVAANASPTLNNTATVSGGGDNTPLNNDSTDTVTNAASSDLTITKTDGVAALVPGTTTTYTIVVSNLGPSDASGTTVNDTPPVTLTGVTWTCVGSTGAVCPVASGSGAIAATVAIFPGAGTLTYTLSGTVSAGATGTLVNAATVTAPAGVTDPTPSNNSATDTDTLTPTANLGITKTSTPDPYVAGAVLTYTITVTNAGPSDVTGASVSDTVPASLSTFTWSCSSPSGACGTGTGNIATTVTLLNGQSATITLSGTVPGATTGPIVNTASVAAPGSVTDPTPANNTSTNTNPTGGTVVDLQVTKTNGVTAVTAGGATTYTLVVSNAGPSAIVGATVTDTAPLGLTFGTWTCVASPGSTCPATGSGDLSVAVALLSGGTATFTVPASISSTATSPLTNTTTVSVPAGNSDPVPANNTASDTDTVSVAPSPVADLIVTKTDGVGSVSAAATTIYTVVLTNNGPDGAANANVTDPAATGLTKTAVICAAATGAVCPASPTVGQLESGLLIPTLPSGGSVTLLITATVTAASGSVSNTVTVAAPAGVADPTPANNSATDIDTVGTGVLQADLFVTKTNGSTSVTSGGTTTYTIVVANAGPDAADGAIVADLAAAGLTKTAISCAVAGGAVCPVNPTIAQIESGLPIPTLPLGGSVTLTVTASVTAASGGVSNTVTVAPPTGTIDPAPGNDSATDTDTVGISADVSVTKTNGVTTVTPGAATTYTIVVSNPGPSDANGATVSDTPPVTLTGVTWTCAGTSGAICPAASGSGAITTTVAVFPSGGVLTYVLSGTVSAGATGTLVNTATVTAPAGVTDPTPGNNSATDTDTLTPTANLGITKTSTPDPYVAGAALTYTITMTNAGPSDVTGASVSDTVPASLSTFTWTCTSPSGACGTGTGNIATTVTLLSAQSATITLSGTVPVGTTGSIVNTASVTAPGGVTDPTPGNNTSTNTNPTGPTADLQVTKTNGVTAVTAGGATTYTIVAGNAGTSAVVAAMVTDTAPLGLTFGSWTCAASVGSACPATGSGDLSVAVSLLAGGTATFTVPATISSTATSPLTNTATIAVPGGISDPAPGNNSASDTDTVSAPPSAIADLIVTKTDGVASVSAAGATTYTVVVTNNGPDGAANAIVTDPAAPGLTKTAVICAAATGAVCPPSPTVVQLESGLTIPTFPTGGSVTLLVTATVTAASGSVSNTVTVAAPAGVTDPTPANNSATDTDTVGVGGPPADVSVTKTNGTASVTSGGTTIYTIIVGNAGPTAADGAVVTDVVAAGLMKSAVSCTAASGAVCPASPTVAQLESGLPIPTLPTGGSVTLLVTATVTAAIGSVVNTVTVAPPAGVADPAPANNTATDTDTVGPGVLNADLSVTKTNASTSVTSGGTTTYTIVLANAGPAAADGAVVTDLVAAGLIKTAISCAAANGAVCPVSSTIAQLESGLPIPTLPSGASVTLLVTASVTAASGSVSNTVTVSPPTGTIDPAPANNGATDTDAVGISADVSVTKTNGVTTVTSGGTTAYTVVIANAGLAAADGAIVADAAAAGLMKTAVSCVAASGAVCPASPTVAQLESGLTIPTLPAGGSVTLTVAASVTATSGSISNTVTVSPLAGVTDPVPGNNSATDTDTVGPALAADLSVSKTDRHSEIVPGQTLTYTILVRNAGPGPVVGASVSDPAPASLGFVSWTCTASTGSSCIEKGSGSLLTPVSLAVRGSATFTVTAVVAGNATGTIQNTATVTSPVGVSDPVAANNSATDSDRVATQQVEVGTRAGTPTIVGPSTFEIPYTVTIVNSGRVPLTNTQVSDSLSAAFAAGNPTLTLAAPLSAAPTGGATASQCAVNGAFTGLGATPSTSTNLLVGTASLAVKQGCVLTFTVRVAYQSQAEVPRDAQVNRAEAWTSATPGGLRLASDMSEAEAVLRVPRVDITKALTALTQVGEEPVFDVSYAFVIRNTAEIPASNVQVIEDLATTFAAGTPTITLESGPTLGGGDGTLTLARDFNGTTRTSLLTGTDVLPPGSSRALTLTVRLRFASAREIPEGQDIDNTARVTTSVTAGGIVISGDDSTDVTESGASPQADDVPRTTAARFAPKARLSLQMTASTRVVEVGDTLSYAIRVANLGGPTLPLTILTDLLPLGFRYVPGSTRMAAGAETSQPMADPPGSPGPSLAFTIPAQPTSDEVTLIYRARLGPGALQGSGVNTAEAATLGAGAVRSNIARVGVVISGGVFTPDACVIGKIFADVNDNHMQDDEELGIPGVHVRFEEGTVLVSDVEGKYSYCGLTPATHVLKVDRLTLPVGARLTESGNRNAGDAGSLFVDLKFGEVHRADFVEGSADPRVLEQIVARRARGEVWEPSFEGSPTSTLTQRGRAANQQPVPVVLGTLTPSPGADVPADAVTEVVLGVSGTEPLAPDIAESTVGVIRLAADRAMEAADGITPVRLTIRLMDPDGVAVENTMSATIEVSGGQLQFPDYRIAEAGFEIGDARPATQIRIEHGVGVVELIAPATAQDVRVRVTAGDASVEGTLTFVPHSRPMLAIGLVEGQIALTRVDASAVTPVRASEAFDRELHRFSSDFSNGQGLVGGRAALFLKGSVKGDYLLTLAYDSEKEDRGVLFRDIQPEAFYPIYGDSSLKGFDAQTSGRFYLRAERGRSYLLYGDLQTAGFSPEARDLGTYSRTLTGAQEHFENKTVVANVFVSRDSLTQVIDEIAGLGISGPYSVSNANGVSGTEKVEIVTRDRNQPAVILSAVPLTRFTDYEFEPFSGRLLFRRPVPAVDERLNPMSVRVTYEVDRGGEKSWVGGVDGQVKLGRLVQLGGSWAEDRAPGAPYRLRSLNGTLRIGGTTTMVAEGAQTIGTVNTTTFNQSGLFNLAQASGAVEGFAGRVELLHDSSLATARIFAGTSDPGFNNPASTLTGGRTEIGGRGTLTVSEPMRIVGEVIRSEDRLTGGHREGAFLAVEAKFAHNLALEVGVRRATESLVPAQGTSVGVSLFGLAGSGGSFGFGPATGGNIDPITGLPFVNPGLAPQLSATSDAPQSPEAIDVFTLRGKLTFALAEALNVYGEAEQDVRDADKKLAALGGQLRMTERTRLYLRHEFISSLDGPYALSNRQRSYRTVFGVSSTYLKNADVFSEYRMRDAMSGREAHAAIGLRNLWPIAEGIALSTSFERLHAIAGLDQAATAASVALEYTRNPRLKSTGRVEWRHDTANDSWLSTAGVARKLSRDWTLLSKNYFQLTAPRSGPHQVQNRFWLGGAYRDTATNRVNLLSRYEFRFEDTLGLPFGLGALREVHSVSTHVDFHPVRAWTLFGQHALKWVHDRTEEPVSRFMTQLVSGRVGYDVSKRIDLGALASVMWSAAEGGRRDALGGEVGFLLRNNLWLSLGYNVTGFVDRDMIAVEQTTRGGFVRLRMKFDENLFSRDDITARTARRP